MAASRFLLLFCIPVFWVTFVYAQSDDERVFWEAVEGCTVAEEVKAYLESYPEGHFKSEAKACLVKLVPDRADVDTARTKAARKKGVEVHSQATIDLCASLLEGAEDAAASWREIINEPVSNKRKIEAQVNFTKKKRLYNEHCK